MFLRPNLRCFYCGARSSEKRRRDVHKWKCTSCLAVNFLDENGNITEPPASSATSLQTRYATRGRPITSPELGQTADEIFCSTCIKNQYLVAHNLAEYLPDPSDDRVAIYEKNLPQYRASLEARYPQVCRSCEPRVRERLKLTGYAAKADHLRRLAGITRQTQVSRRQGFGLRLLFTAGRLCWWLAYASQITWHAHSLKSAFTLDCSEVSSIADKLRCLLQTWTNAKAFESIVASAALASLIFTACSIWWNPTLTRIPRKKWHGVRDFYKLQAALGVVRLTTWQLLKSEHTHDQAIRHAIHAIALGFNIFVLLISSVTIKPAELIHVSFEVKDDHLLNHSAGSPSHGQLVSGPLTPRHDKTFPFEMITDIRAISRTIPSPVTSTSEDGIDDVETVATTIPDSDAMDIDTPEKNPISWSPRKSSVLPSTSPYHEPSPFRGHLPPAPVGPSHRLRNPPNKPTFQKASDIRQKAFSDGLRKSRAAYESDTGEASSQSYNQSIEFAPPRFFAPDQQETGLESLFTGLISLSDEPTEVRQGGGSGATDQRLSTSSKTTGVLRTFAEASLATSAALWTQVMHDDSDWHSHLLAAIFFVVLIDSTCSLYDQVRQTQFVADVIMHGVEILFSTGLVAYHIGVWRPLDLEKSLLEDLGKGSVSLFAVRKFFAFTQVLLQHRSLSRQTQDLPKEVVASSSNSGPAESVLSASVRSEVPMSAQGGSRMTRRVGHL